MCIKEMTISALYCIHNEEDYIKQSLELILPYVDEVIFVDHGSTDKTREIVENLKNPKIKIFDYPYNEPVDMGAVRTYSLEKATGDWIWQIDADEWYPEESCKAIVRALEAPGEAISFRVPYYNLSWRNGWKQANFEHYPDRLYKREVVEKYEGVLPIDMTIIKMEYRECKFKGKGIEGVLEYDNPMDISQWSTRQQLLDAPFYHLARTRGYNYEFNKWTKYHQNINRCTIDKAKELARSSHWVNGVYDIEKIDVPFEYGIENPKVSVIITNYNYQQFVGLAIESVLKQTYPAYEIIVVDDGSTDRSIQVINKYPVILFKQPNQGVAVARNKGGHEATGDYLIFLDADDELAPDYIEKTVKEMKGDIQVVYTDIQFIGEANFINRQPDFSQEEMKKWQVVPSSCALIVKRAWELVGGFKNDEIFEDWGFWLRVSQKYNFKHLKEPLFRYRKHGKSRIDYLDAHQAEGFLQLRDRYGITRDIDFNRIEEAKKIIGL